jgi:hypothetical protein
MANPFECQWNPDSHRGHSGARAKAREPGIQSSRRFLLNWIPGSLGGERVPE